MIFRYEFKNGFFVLFSEKSPVPGNLQKFWSNDAFHVSDWSWISLILSIPHPNCLHRTAYNDQGHLQEFKIVGATLHIYENIFLSFALNPTLKYKINVPVRLLISQIFSHRYALISDGTFIKIRIFRNSSLWTFAKFSKKEDSNFGKSQFQ